MLELGKLGGSPPSTTCSTVLAHRMVLKPEVNGSSCPEPEFLPVKAPQAPSLSHTKCPHLGRQLRAVLQHCVQNLHVVGVPSIGELIEDHKLDGGTQVVLVCIQQLPGHKSQAGEGGRPGCPCCPLARLST